MYPSSIALQALLTILLAHELEHFGSEVFNEASGVFDETLGEFDEMLGVFDEYRIYCNKRPGAYKNFPISGGGRLLERGA